MASESRTTVALCALGVGAVGAALLYYQTRARGTPAAAIRIAQAELPIGSAQDEAQPVAALLASADPEQEVVVRALLEEDPELASAFDEACELIKSLPEHHLSRDTLLQLYGLYKQATVGPAQGRPPPLYDLVGRAKWDAWKALGATSRGEARYRYLALTERAVLEDIKGTPPKQADARQDNHGGGLGPAQSTLRSDTADPNDWRAGLRPPAISRICGYARDGDIAGVTSVLNAGESCDACDDADGITALMWACDRGHLDVVKLLLSAGSDINRQDTSGLTAMHYAVLCNNEDVASFLLQSGASVDVPDENGHTASQMRPLEWDWWPRRK